MIRKEDSIFFTDQDREKLSVKKYTTEELINKEKGFRKKRNKRRCAFLIFLVADIVLSILFKQIDYPLYIILAFIIFITVLYEYIDRIDLKAVRRKFYIEILVKEKMKPETVLEQTLSPGSKATIFFPIKGIDMETGYESIFYVEQEQYNAEVGDKIRIGIQGERL